jgi:RNA polymerase sigma factor FliA
VSRPADPMPLTPKQQKLVLDCQGFVRNVERYYAYRYRFRLKVDDVRQIVQLALTEAARTFDPERGIEFAKYAWKHVDGALADATRHEWAARALYAAAMAACAEFQIVENEIALEGDAASDVARHDPERERLGTAGVLAATSLAGMSSAAEVEATRTPEDQALVAELRAALALGMEKLPERGRRVMALHYGEDRSLREVSDALAVSYATVKRDHDAALDALRERLAAADAAEET